MAARWVLAKVVSNTINASMVQQSPAEPEHVATHFMAFSIGGGPHMRTLPEPGMAPIEGMCCSIISCVTKPTPPVQFAGGLLRTYCEGE
jgi:hypothetical protein